MSIDLNDRYFRGGQGGHFLRFMVHPNALRGNKKESRANRHPIKETDLYVKKILAVKHRVTSTFNDDSSPPGLFLFFQETRKRAEKEKIENDITNKRVKEKQKEFERNSFNFLLRAIHFSLYFSIERVVKHSRNTSEIPRVEE